MGMFRGITLSILIVCGAAQAEYPLVAASLDPLTTVDDARAALEHFGEIVAIKRLSPDVDGRGISVFRAVYGNEGSRITAARRMAEAGMLGYPVDPPDECALAVKNRKDQSAVAALDANPLAKIAEQADEDLAEAEAELAAAELLLAEAQEQLDAAEAQLRMNVKMYSAAREATTKARSVAQLASEQARRNPTRANLSALFAAAVDLGNALRLEREAADDLDEAEDAVLVFKQDFGQIKADRDRRATKVYEKQKDSDIAHRALNDAWDKVRSIVLQDIIALADTVAAEAEALAKTADKRKLAAGAMKPSFGATMIRLGLMDEADDLDAALENDAVMAGLDAQHALTLAKKARSLPPITRETGSGDPRNQAVFLLLDEIGAAVEQLAVNQFVLATDSATGSALQGAGIRLSALLKAVCADTECGAIGAELEAAASAMHFEALQFATRQSSETRNMLTNVQKSKHDAAMAAIQNAR